LAQSSITMGKLKNFHFGNKSYKDYEDEFLDDEYGYYQHQKKKKKKKTDLADDHEDFVDEY